jgi:hypothetical protein
VEQLKGFLLAEPIRDKGRLEEKYFCQDVVFEWMSCLMLSTARHILMFLTRPFRPCEIVRGHYRGHRQCL